MQRYTAGAEVPREQNHPDGTVCIQPKVDDESRSLLRGFNNRLQNSPSVNDFYFSQLNPTVQTYYRFKTSQLTPFAALHTRPLDGPFGRMMDSPSSLTYGSNGNNNYTLPLPTNHVGTGSSQVSNVTGLLRRSAVLPCHGALLYMGYA